MNIATLDNIQLKLHPDEVLKSLNLADNSEAADVAGPLIGEANRIVAPKAVCGEAYVEDRGDDFVVLAGKRFDSRVMAVNMKDAHRAFPFLATCGAEIAEWAEAKSDGMDKLVSGAVVARALLAAIAAVDGHIRIEYHIEKTGMMNPGSLPDWPLSEQEKLFSLLGGAHESIGVKLKEDQFMWPSFTASGIKFPTDTNYENCMLCPRVDCPGRRADYDPGLFGRKYEKEEP